MTPDPRRPGFHFTAASGWMNDPRGVSWHDGRYELFYQFNPGAPDWVVALEPGPGEDGCGRDP